MQHYFLRLIRRLRPRSAVSAYEIADFLKAQFPQLIRTGIFVPPGFKCSRWILLCGPAYRDEGFRGTLLIDTSKIYDWARHHAEATWTSVESEQEAKEHFPHWISDIDTQSENVTFLNKSQRDFLQPYALNFIHQSAFKLWCPTCNVHHENIIEKNLNRGRAGSTSKWREEWWCPGGHLLFARDQEIRWILR